MPYLVEDNLSNNISNGELTKALWKIIERIEKIEKELMNYQIWRDPINAAISVNKEQDQ